MPPPWHGHRCGSAEKRARTRETLDHQSPPAQDARADAALGSRFLFRSSPEKNRLRACPWHDAADCRENCAGPAATRLHHCNGRGPGCQVQSGARRASFHTLRPGRPGVPGSATGSCFEGPSKPLPLVTVHSPGSGSFYGQSPARRRGTLPPKNVPDPLACSRLRISFHTAQSPSSALSTCDASAKNSSVAAARLWMRVLREVSVKFT